VLRYVVGTYMLTEKQLAKADVTGNGTVSALDAALILQRAVGLIAKFPVQQGKTSAAPTFPNASCELSLSDASAKSGEKAPVTISIEGTEIRSGQFGLSYDSEMFKVIEISPVKSNFGHSLVYNESEGQLKFSFASSKSIKGNVPIAKLTFQVLPEAHLKTDSALIVISQAQFNEGLVTISKQHSTIKILPDKFALFQNYPNPFNPETWLPYQLVKDSEVVIRIYNAKGQLVRTLRLGNQSIGSYVTKKRAAYWDGKNNSGERVSSGVYFYTLQAENFTATKRLVLLK